MKLVMNVCLPILLLLGLGPRVASAIKVIPVMEEPKTNDAAVVKVEEHLKKHHRKLMTAIDKFRAEICANMKEKHGIEFKTFEACHKFMEKACKPGKDQSMDGDRKEVSSGEGYCKEYFPEAEKKAEKEVAKQEAEEEEKGEEEVLVGGPSPGPAPAPMPAPQTDKAPAVAAPAGGGPAAASGTGPAPSPGPFGAPGPAPVPGPFTPGKSGGKPWGPIADDEAYYYKSGGKDDMRLHMDEKMKLPTQGYWGQLVEHEDMQTATGDWQKEFGPKAGHDSIAAVCRQQPDNPWCMRRGYGRHFRSSCPAAFTHLLPLGIGLIAMRAI